MLGKSIKKVVTDFEQLRLDEYGNVAKTEKPVRREHVVAGLCDQWFPTSAFRLGGPGSRNAAVLFENITDYKESERLTEWRHARAGAIGCESARHST